jgi:hypothetical protein
LSREHGFIKRQRNLKALELLSTLIVCCSSNSVQWLSQIHRAYCGLSKRRISYKPFHNQLRKPKLGELLQSTLSHLMSQGYKRTLFLSGKPFRSILKGVVLIPIILKLILMLNQSSLLKIRRDLGGA